jgi:hypothetical protein
MQHKLLLGSTALVSAGILMSSGAYAQEMRVGGFEVVLGGYTEFGVSAATKDTLNNSSNNRNYAYFMDNEVHIDANGATQSGILYGSHLELEVGSGLGNSNNAFVDEVGLYFSGNFGRVELGQEDSPADVMGIGGADAQAGTGGIDGDTSNLTQFETIDSGDSTKASYFTPRVAGFQVGASWTPDNGDGVGRHDGDLSNIIEAGVNWVGALGPLDLTVAATGFHSQVESGGGAGADDDDVNSWDAGVLFGFGGFTIGVGGGQNTNNDDFKSDYINAGIKYGFGAANVSVGYNFNDPDQGDSSNVFAVSGDVGLLPGVTLKGDVTYNTDDPNANCNDAGACDDTDDTIAGVVSVQLDY